MSLSWLKIPSKHTAAKPQPETSPVEMTAYKVVETGFFPDAPDPTVPMQRRIVETKGAVCQSCKFSEEAEEDFVMIHCGQPMTITTITYYEYTAVVPLGGNPARVAK